MFKIGKLIDLTGMKFGELTVIERAEDAIHPCGNKSVRWRCLCSCGNETIVRGSDLKNGQTKSCGCLNKNRKHGLSHSRIYKIWCTIKERCYNENHPVYKWYGAKGVDICEEWKNDFVPFYEWAMESGYDENADYGECTLDRIDPTKGYSPDNCRWVSMFEQGINKRKPCITAVYKNEEKPLAKWCKELGLNYKVVNDRLRLGWSIEDAFEKPRVRKKHTKGGKTIEYNGKTQTIKEWSEELGVYEQTIRKRLKSGWSDEEALIGKKKIS